MLNNAKWRVLVLMLALTVEGLVAEQARPEPMLPAAGPETAPSAGAGTPVLPPPDDGSGRPGAMAPTPPSPPVGGALQKALDPDASSPFAGGAMPLLNPVVGHAPFRADYRASWFPEESVARQGTHLGYVQQDLSLTCPLWQDGHNEWTASAHIRNEAFAGHALFPDTGRPFPDDLWNVGLSTSYRHLFENGWIAGGTLSVGSPSDRPFAGIGEINAGVHAFLRVPSGDHNAWLFSLSYSATSELPIPIPGVAYVWQAADNLVLNIGLPFMALYRPTEDVTLELSYMLLTTVHARATYRLCKPLRIYAGYDWNNESYLPVDRPSENDRLFYFDQKLTAGMRAILSRNVSLDLSGGYVFDRYYFEGHSITDSHKNRIDVGAGPFVSLQCAVRW